MPRSRAERADPVRPSGALVDAVRQDIVNGQLEPGTRVTEAFLAQRYGVSRVPVREALRALEAEGFIESRPHIGSRVALIPFDEADDLFAVREALEIATARRAAERARTLFDDATPNEEWFRTRRELAQILDEGDAYVERDDLEPLVALNDRYHLLVAELSGSRTLATLLRQLSHKIEWLYALDTFSRGKRLWPDHRVILGAIDAGDCDRAAELMGWHVRESRIGYALRNAPLERVEYLRTNPPVPGAGESPAEPPPGEPAVRRGTGGRVSGRSSGARRRS
ncbi:GntR family transcriptional regulator [Nocardioides sp. KR10-350]|uniref:GntR family transcriptional regulator n=1 Tax=Nocardioides cheoyonin TaxID=3156615 RepID=UPI0032B45A9E